MVLVVAGNAFTVFDDALSRPAWAFFLESAIYAFHMPLFFFLAGCFIETSRQAGLGRLIRSKSETLLYPYVLWSALYTALYEYGGQEPNARAVLASLARIFYDPYTHRHIWFLYVLFILLVLYAALRRAGISRLGMLILSLAMRSLRHALMIGNTFIGRLMGRLAYISLGALAFEPLKARLKSASDLALAAIACLGYAVVGALAAAGIERSYGLSIVSACFGIAATVSLAELLDRRAALAFIRAIGRISLAVYVTHMLVMDGVVRAVKSFGMNEPGLLWVIAAASGIAVPVAAVRLIGSLRKMRIFTLRAHYADRYLA